MRKEIVTERIPIKLWLDDIEAGALAQARNIANLPFAFHHVAIMPDAHQGFGMPVGGVLATRKVVIPNAVGVDIGCGMCAVRTSLKSIGRDDLKQIMSRIREQIPLGFNHHKKAQDLKWMPALSERTPIARTQFDSATRQVGTLGGGNHFIELQQGDDGHVWLMIHSGSRNIGYRVAQYYNDLAKELAPHGPYTVPPKWDLAYLMLDSDEGQNYLAEMQYCIEFAFANRRLMMERVQNAVAEVLPDTQFDDLINIAHNYASQERHFGQDVIVHRKGATQARKGQKGIIPGSQGTASYIVEGLGNKDSFESCSHGAGRRMGRRQAQRELDLETEQKRLDRLGVLHAVRSRRDLDEAPSAYKNIAQVMANQTDLVNILVELKPLAVIKG